MALRAAGYQLMVERRADAATAGLPRIAEGLACAALTWGVLAFGGVYAWGYWPLALLCATAGVAALCARGGFRFASGTRGIAVLMAAVAVAALVQVLPQPLSLLEQISPRRASLLAQLDVNVAQGLVRQHSLSLDAASTWRALGLYVCFGLTALGIARCSTRGALRVAWFVSLLGIAVALTGIVQRPLYAGAIYGFWKPMMHGSPFGPFVNKNHFAGWVAMAIPLALGCAGAMLTRARGTVRPGFRAWMIWLSTRDANQALQAVCAAVIMAVALALTLSRSGMLSVAAALIICGGAGLRRFGEGLTRPLAVLCVVLALVVSVDAAGLDTLAARFDADDTAGLSGRIPIWTGTTEIFRDFWGLGSGLNTYGIATLFYPAVVPTEHLREAHNDYLQLAVEGGALLGVPILLAMMAFAVAVWRRFRTSDGAAYWVRLGAVGGIVAIAIQSSVDFSLQMPGNAALFATLCGIALHEERFRSG